VCPNHRFSCPTDTACVTSKYARLDTVEAAFDCAHPDTNTTTPATMNVHSKMNPAYKSVLKGRATSGVCSALYSYLPSDCRCYDDGQYGGSIDCTLDVRRLPAPTHTHHPLISHADRRPPPPPLLLFQVYLTEVGVRGVLQPCGTKATIGLTIYETTLGFSYSKSISSGTSFDAPVPGLNVGIPVVGSAGVVAKFSFTGTVSAVRMVGSLDVCGSILGFKQCGSSLCSFCGLPVSVISATVNFNSVCSGGGSPTDDDYDPMLDDDGAPTGSTHYGNPYTDYCLSDEQVLQLSGVPGAGCVPIVDTYTPCPTDGPAMGSSSATPEVITDGGVCALVCSYDGVTPSGNCPSGASCWLVPSGAFAICTYDDQYDGATKGPITWGKGKYLLANNTTSYMRPKN
jgi:hypothetical protein